MPITRNQFERGIDPEMEAWMKIIQRFLGEHRGEAFTTDELWKAVWGKDVWPVEEMNAYEEALRKLASEGTRGSAERRMIRGKFYYALREQDEIPF